MSSREGGRGGYQRPAEPAPVSGPGALSARTDGGPGDKQPLRVASGGPYGSREARETQQRGAPLSAGGEPGPGAPVPQGPPTAGGTPVSGTFGPTQRPAEPSTAGMVGNPAAEVPHPDLVLRQLVQQYPSPYLMRLLEMNL